MTDHDPQPAASLAAQFPGWNIWHGKHTGSWWAVPPAGHPHGDLVNATDLDGLARKIQAADDARDVRRHRDMGPRGLRLRRVTPRECCQCGPRDVGPATTSVSNWRSRHPPLDRAGLPRPPAQARARDPAPRGRRPVNGPFATSQKAVRLSPWHTTGPDAGRSMRESNLDDLADALGGTEL